MLAHDVPVHLSTGRIRRGLLPGLATRPLVSSACLFVHSMMVYRCTRTHSSWSGKEKVSEVSGPTDGSPFGTAGT